ncbi:hypothetical protein Hypma_013011 [Hypsizygus marmoreus]|uniref:Uncharacterized protein n=1 Tax=Hypsizygus marmoreus TaxID=39966 RepID=A0A369JH16_HYPMA|nr:hypothetical protein Hypma_013011 [Hypsizygus marmoreus]
MALTRSSSLLSCDSVFSSYPSTECETTSGSSTSTVPGPGALTGKALKALGVATLRGLGRIVMAKHLATVTHSFPHTDEQASSIRNIDAIYDDLLEFSRPGMYSAETSDKALGIILSQIGMGQTRFLIKALSRWHSVEVHILLLRILIQLAPLWNPSLKLVFSSPLFHLYSETQPWGHLSPVRLVLFLSRVIRSSSWACQAALDVGFLDVLMAICHNYEFKTSNITKSGRDAYPLPYNYKHLLIACNAALLDVTAYPEYRSVVASHPISSMWPKHSISPVDTLPFTMRREALLLGPDTDVTFDDHSPYITLSLPDICAQPCVSTLPAEKLLESLTFEITHDQAFRVFLARSGHTKKVALLSQLIECMSKSIVPSNKHDADRNDPSWRYRLSFSLRFITEVARSNPNNRQALLDSGVVAYLLRVNHDETATIANIIREYGSAGVVNARGPRNSRIQRSIYAAFAALFENPSSD